MTKPNLNCAIYTRKSSDEGLEQSFNSLDAQREACEAYIKSQKHEGWKVLSTAYDDGGYSGGSMERPGLQKLMGDIQADRINTVVVYKVDRLTRSLADFAKMVELFDKNNVSFVSVTQQFNTTTSMGRLTLNVLLSFAQFEREVTGERIRDKIAASKKKGMWMGGTVPLGYISKDRTLVPVPTEAKKINYIYERYLDCGSVGDLQVELKRDGILSKDRTSKTGNRSGGCHFARGALYELLQNPIYIGQIRHKDIIHQGLHEAIVPEHLWQAVQKKLADNRIDHPGQANAGPSLLTGLLFDHKGERLTPTSTVKSGKRYRYYVLASTTKIKTKEKLRLPAGELEELVIEKLRAYLRDQILEGADDLITALESNELATKKSALIRLIEKIAIHTKQIIIHLKDNEKLYIEYQFSTHGPHRKMLTDTKSNAASEAQKEVLLRSFLQGYIWRKRFLEEPGITISSIAKAENKSEIYIVQLIQLSLMAPDLVAKILKGDIPSNVTRQSLIYTWPISWAAQRQKF